MEKMNRKIRIFFVDFWPGFDMVNNCFTNMLIHIYGKKSIAIVNKNPDYLFYSNFGYENLKYSCIKIFYTGENIVPDFNLCDYAMGMHEISFGDRYIWLPLFYMYDDAYAKAVRKHEYSDAYYLNRKFCSFVVSNAVADSSRKQMITLLNKYKTVDSGGRYLNNVGGRVKDKVEFVSRYKFSLCFENSMANGYTTEKILEGFAGNTIPIYWGNPNVAALFNKNAFINCNDYLSLEDVVEFIKRIDSDDDLYLRMVKEPIFKSDSNGKKEVIDKNLEKFLKNIFNQEGGDRINKICIGEQYYKRMRFFRWGFSVHYFISKMFSYFRNFALLKKHDRGIWVK